MLTIGASDMPIIMGVSPYKTPLDLWKVKTGLAKPEKQNWAQKVGTELEPVARAWFNERMLLKFEPCLMKHPDVPAFTASLDGWCAKTRQAVEIKNSGLKDHTTSRSGKVPDHYLHQVQWQYIVSGAKNIYYLSYQEKDPVILEVAKPTQAEETALIQAAASFLELVKSRVPPPLSKDDYLVFSDRETMDLATDYRIKLRQVDALKEEIEGIRSKLVDKAKTLNHGKVDFGGCFVYKSTRKGQIDYKKTPIPEGFDVETLRGPETEIFTVKAKDDT